MRKVVRQIGKRFCAFIVALTFGFLVYSFIPADNLPEKFDYPEENYLQSLHMIEVYKCPAKPLKPNPFVLSVKIESDRSLSLNHEEVGSLDQPTVLKNELSRIFEMRELVGIYKGDTLEIDKTVTIRAASSIKFEEAVRLIKILEEAGITTIQFDPEYCNTGGGSA